jgi:hypothetical protein
MDRRQSARVSVRLPVQIWGLDLFDRPFSAAAMVTNLSSEGIVVEGMQQRLRTGELLDVRMGDSRAEFRVIWVSDTGEMGMQNLSAQALLPPSVLMHCSQTLANC